ncbi:MAG: hypothetical protein C4527_00700 [Candidatus Omnitrophota bacterium]|jgi:hypothetical protein|nr:MAG: hypothetical protein C4527_00700 [Candidatus Omnitrophota bacterium]
MNEKIPRFLEIPGVIFLVYALLAFVFLWPLPIRLGSIIPAETLDPGLFIWQMHSNFQAFASGFGQPFDGNIFHPEPHSRLYTESMFFVAALMWPLYLCGVSTIACYNLACLLALALAGYAAWSIACDVTNNKLLSLAGGAIFAFSTFHLVCLNRPPLLFSGVLLLAFRNLYLFLQEGKKIHWIGYLIFSILLPGCCFYYTFLHLWITVLLLIFYLVFKKRFGSIQNHIRLGVCVAWIGLFYFVIWKSYVPIWQQQVISATATDYYYQVTSAAVANFIWPNWLNIHHTALPTLSIPFTDLGFFPGFYALIFVGIAIYAHWPSQWITANPTRRKIATIVFLLAFLWLFLILYCALYGGILTRLGPLKISIHNLHRLQMQFGIVITVGFFLRYEFSRIAIGMKQSADMRFPALAIAALLSFCFCGMYPLRWLTEPFSPLSYFQFHGRFGIFLLLFGSVMAVIGLQFLLEKFKLAKYQLIVCVFITFLVIEECWPGIRFSKVPTQSTLASVYTWLQNQGGVHVIAELPIHDKQKNSWYQLNSIYHNKQLINGYAWMEPPWYGNFGAEMNQFPSDRSIQRLKEHEVGVVVIHKEFLQENEYVRIRAEVDSRTDLSLVYEDDKSFVVRL